MSSTEKIVDKEYVVGIDIGGTNTVFGLVNNLGEIKGRGAISTKKHETVESFVEELYHVVSPIIDSVGGIEHIRAIGVGAPNANYHTGNIEYAPNLRWKGVVPLARLISDAFHVPTVLTNDANAAALGEMMYGAAKGIQDFIMITLGTGVGSGIVANGQLIYGHDGFAGELGHNIIIPNGRLHKGTGARGSLEVYCSATGVRLTALELLAEYPDRDSLLRDTPEDEIDSRLVYECAMRGDSISKEVYEFTGKILGMALANFVMFSSPKAIILFGGLCKAGDLLMVPTKKSMEENLLVIFRGKVDLLFSQLRESDAAILGSSALAFIQLGSLFN